MSFQLNQKNSIINYKHLLQYIIKKGKKSTLENVFRKGIIFWSKNHSTISFEFTLKNAFINTTPGINVKVKRKGSKNIYVPKKITDKHAKFLSAKWMLASATLKNKRELYEGIIEELIDSSLKRSNCIKKRDDLHKLAEESTINFR